MQVKVEILKKGDSVLNVWDSHVAVKKESGDVEIFRYYLDEEGLPRLADHTILITQGDGSISSNIDGTSINVTTF